MVEEVGCWCVVSRTILLFSFSFEQAEQLSALDIWIRKNVHFGSGRHLFCTLYMISGSFSSPQNVKFLWLTLRYDDAFCWSKMSARFTINVWRHCLHAYSFCRSATVSSLRRHREQGPPLVWAKISSIHSCIICYWYVPHNHSSIQLFNFVDLLPKNYFLFAISCFPWINWANIEETVSKYSTGPCAWENQIQGYLLKQ